MLHSDLAGLASSGSYFVYDLDMLEKQAASLISGNAKIFFACKANPLSNILRTLKNAGMSFDVASEGELHQVLSIGAVGSEIITTGPAKSERFLRLALENQVGTFVIESPNQLHLLQKIAPEYHYQPSVLLRLQLTWEENERSVLGGAQLTPFGMDLDTARELLPQVKLPFLGFHVFQWGNVLSVEKLRKIWQHTIKQCQTLTKDFEVLDVGGGLGVPYFGEEPLQWESVNDLIQDLKQEHKLQNYWLEMGRYIAAPCGIYITTIADRKRTHNQDILVLEGGINHLSRPALVKEPFPAALLRDSQALQRMFSVHGPLCTSLDFLGNYSLPEDVAPGDILVFRYVGAYGFTESMPFFLCHQLAGEAVFHNGILAIVREPQSAAIWQK